MTASYRICQVIIFDWAVILFFNCCNGGQMQRHYHQLERSLFYNFLWIFGLWRPPMKKMPLQESAAGGKYLVIDHFGNGTFRRFEIWWRFCIRSQLHCCKFQFFQRLLQGLQDPIWITSDEQTQLFRFSVNMLPLLVISLLKSNSTLWKLDEKSQGFKRDMGFCNATPMLSPDSKATFISKGC